MQGKIINLRIAKLEERELIYEMGLSTDYMKHCFEESFETGFEAFKENYIDSYFDDKESSVRAGMMICLDATPIGFISYSQVSDFCDREWIYHFGTMELDIWMNGELHCGKGYGLDAIVTLTNSLHEKFNINKFMMCPERKNLRAIKAYRKAGFIELTLVKKQKLLLEIFNQQGLSSLKVDDEYLSEEFCFMVKTYY